jgi:hypothetical protein
MIIEDEIQWDETAPYYLNSKLDLYGDLVKVTYKYKSLLYDNKDSANLIDVTPDTLKNAKVFEVPAMVSAAYEIDLDLQVRNKTYTIHVKTAEK